MERIFIHTTRGATRLQRRSGAKIPNVYQRRAQGWSFGASYPTDNEPYVKPVLPSGQHHVGWRGWKRRG